MKCGKLDSSKTRLRFRGAQEYPSVCAKVDKEASEPHGKQQRGANWRLAQQGRVALHAAGPCTLKLTPQIRHSPNTRTSRKTAPGHDQGTV